MKYFELNYLRLKQSIRLVPKLLWTSILGLELREKVLFSRADFVRAFTKLTQNPPDYMESASFNPESETARIDFYEIYTDFVFGWRIDFTEKHGENFIRIYSHDPIQIVFICSVLVSISIGLQGYLAACLIFLSASALGCLLLSLAVSTQYSAICTIIRGITHEEESPREESSRFKLRYPYDGWLMWLIFVAEAALTLPWLRIWWLIAQLLFVLLLLCIAFWRAKK